MSLTCARIINDARDRHPALSVSNAPVVVALRALSRFQRGIVADIVVRIPAWLALEAEVAFPLADFDAGVDLAALIPAGWQDLVDGFVVYANTPEPRRCRAKFIPWEQRDMGCPSAAYTFRDNTLFFLGSEQKYANVSSFFLTYTAIPADLTSPSSTVILTDDSLDCLADMLAAEWLQRMVGQPAFNVDADAAGLYAQIAAGSRQRYLTRVLSLGQRQSYRVRDTQGAGNPL